MASIAASMRATFETGVISAGDFADSLAVFAAPERIGLRSHIRLSAGKIVFGYVIRQFQLIFSPYPNQVGRMKYTIKSFILGAKEARWILCTTAYGRPARRAYAMGRKLSKGVMGQKL